MKEKTYELNIGMKQLIFKVFENEETAYRVFQRLMNNNRRHILADLELIDIVEKKSDTKHARRYVKGNKIREFFAMLHAHQFFRKGEELETVERFLER
jgi:hypothetical protein